MNSTTNPLVSVVIPCYNYQWCIERAINSVIGQDYSNVEIVIVDDCSTDTSVKRIKNISALSNQITLYTNDRNRGLSYTRNRGVLESSGSFICFLDPDDEFLSNKISKQVIEFENDPSLHMVYGKALVYDEYGKWIDTYGTMYDKTEFRHSNSIPCQSIMMRREVYLVEGGCREELSCCEDWDLWYRLIGRYNIKFVNRPTYILHKHPGQLSHKVASKESAVKEKYYKINDRTKRLLVCGGAEYLNDVIALKNAIDSIDNCNYTIYWCDPRSDYYVHHSMCSVICGSWHILRSIKHDVAIGRSGDVERLIEKEPNFFNIDSGLYGSCKLPDSDISKYRSLILELLK